MPPHARAGEAKGRQIGRPLTQPEGKIEYPRLLRAQGDSLGVIAYRRLRCIGTLAVVGAAR
ncbi:hypothetical protein GCM10022226_80010 [Sphaerisporangium flaviroseum]|uniref:Uncharacterized protein n=1 Tax=Sphaerisporangium flaviroseum TaxID=509199 RepID=A0ABP7JH08_9ACTN